MRGGAKFPKLPGRSMRLGVRSDAAPLVAAFTDANAMASVPVLPVVVTLGLSFMAYRAAVYARIQYITAALLGNRTPRGAQRVLEIGVGGGKNLYYYPKDMGTLVAVDPAANEELLMRSAVAANVILDYRKGRAEDLDIASNSIDAVISTYTLGCIPLATRGMAVAEIARVLKPGAPFIYVEMLRGACAGTLELIEKSPDFSSVECDEGWKTMFNDPHAIGFATKRGVTSKAKDTSDPDFVDDMDVLEGKLGKRKSNKSRK